ncbi:hypothetical protein [Candidatus Poriferisodalis sp.]|uniref:hypothetical protein n=1 Tax=Candidatus Poriferisodalis sp. TaxID=3101277 RepID=UPI003B0193E7
MRPFTADDLRSALFELAKRLRRRGAHARLYVIGGAIEGDYGAVIEAVLAIARERSWPTTWLNEQATPYMPSPDRREAIAVLEHPHLIVAAASAAHMQAMKTRSARRTDVQDIRRLAQITGVATVEGIEDLIAVAFPSNSLGDRQRQWLRAALGTAPPGSNQHR